MTWPSFVNLLSLAIGFVAGLFFCVGHAKLNPSAIGELAGTYAGGNPHLANSFRVLKADYLCGGFALCATFSLQFISNVPGILPETQVVSESRLGAVLALVIGAALGGFLLLLRPRLVAQLAVTSPPMP